MNIFYDEHLEILNAMLKHNVRFLLIGGYAVIAHGYRRTTGDMDLWLEPNNDNKTLFTNALRNLDFEEDSLKYLKSIDFEESFVFSFGEEPQRVDFLTQINQVTFEEAYNNRLTENFENLVLPIINFRELILSKINTGRAKDIADIEELQRIEKSRKMK